MKDNTQIIIDRLIARIRELENGNQTAITECARNTQSDSISVQELLDQPIEKYFKSVRIVNCLKVEKIETIRDLVQKKRTDLLGMPNFSHASLETILKTLESMRLSIGIDFDNYIEFGESQRIAEFRYSLMKERNQIKKDIQQNYVSQKKIDAFARRLQEIKEILHNL